MPFRTLRSLTASIVSLLVFCAPAFAAETADEANAEAERLYARANDYVAHITEKGYSYAYIQFYWKRAQSNIDRIARVYPQTPTGRKILTEELKLASFDLPYFRDRVLPRLEEKRLASFDAVNCAIFLYNLAPERWDAPRVAALESILEVLSRQQRWSEALSFPVLDEHKPLLFTTVFRVAARFKQQKIVNELIANATPQIKELYWPILAEAMALNGTPRTELSAFLKEHSTPAVKLAVLNGTVEREIWLRRAAALKLDITKGLQRTHYVLLSPDVRDDVEAVANSLFPTPTPASRALLAKYQAALGRRPPLNAPADEHLAYLEHLAVAENFDEMSKYLLDNRLAPAARQPSELKLIELYAQEGRDQQGKALRAAFDAAGGALSDRAVLAEFRGRIQSTDYPLTVRERTFSELQLKDPCHMARAIMEWSLTPNRSIRGAAPYDSVVQKYLPGFENLPLPKSKDVQEAASTSRPF